MQFQSLGRKDPLEKELATYSSILAWKIPRTEEPGKLQFMGLQRVEHDLATEQQLMSSRYVCVLLSNQLAQRSHKESKKSLDHPHLLLNLFLSRP